jgi:hypothetical protein
MSAQDQALGIPNPLAFTGDIEHVLADVPAEHNYDPA